MRLGGAGLGAGVGPGHAPHLHGGAARVTHPAFEGTEPYVVAIVELAEGPRATGNLVDCVIDDVRVGMAVELGWDEPGADGISLPLWHPA